MLKVLDGVPNGVTGVIAYAVDHGRGMPAFADASFYSFSPYVRLTIWGIIIVVVNEQLFLNSADQIAIQRLLSTSSYRQAKRSLYVAAFGVVPLLMVLWLLGLAMFSFYGTQATVSQPKSGDEALFHFIATQLPAPLPGLILAALLAAVMSTLDSGINSLATVATKDFYERFVRPDASERQQVAFSRWITLLAGAFAIATGLLLSQLSDRGGETVAESSMVWLTLSVALPPVFLLGVTSRRATARHALVQLAVAWVVTAGMIVWYLTSPNGDHRISFTCVGAPGPLLALVIGYGMSWTAPRSRPGELDGLTLWG